MKQQKRSPVLNARLLAVPLLLAGSPAFAAPPDAGSMLEEVRPAPVLPRTEAPAPRVEEQAVANLPNGMRVMVKGLRISGQTAFAEAELMALVSDGIGKEMTLAELNQLAARITQHYRQHGYLVARAYLPAQDIRDGEVSIAILEGQLGKVEIVNAAGLAESALAPVAALPTGQPLQGDSLESGLLSLSDLPGVVVKSTLKPGESIGTSDLLVEVTPGKAVIGSLDLDNYGNRYSGDIRIGGSLYFNNPLKRGDQVSLRAQTSGSGLDYGGIAYQLPVGSHGTRIGATWSEMRYLLGKEYGGLDVNGEAGVGSVHVQHPFVRSRGLNLYGQARYESKQLIDRVGATATQIDKTLDNWTVGVSGDRSDAFGGGGVNSFSLSHTSGSLALDAISLAIDAVTAQKQGSFGKTEFSFQRLQRLTDVASFYFSYAGQWADRNLDSAEKFTLGGVYSVRAYPQGEANGDEGQLATAELRWRVGDNWQFKGFYDEGRVTINRSPWLAGINERRLSGAGVGATFSADQMRVDLLVAWKNGTGVPTSDVDRSPRFWMQAVRYF
ncbi:MAG TPA: ShlB/FhaC/HecB family hemolysin secretion/activation protein [Gallionella sp.]|nr:ShlB/FhaC/HecB family hemolysin secretion/activation protein [Gallionella sp.]